MKALTYTHAQEQQQNTTNNDYLHTGEAVRFYFRFSILEGTSGL